MRFPSFCDGVESELNRRRLSRWATSCPSPAPSPPLPPSETVSHTLPTVTYSLAELGRAHEGAQQWLFLKKGAGNGLGRTLEVPPDLRGIFPNALSSSPLVKPRRHMEALPGKCISASSSRRLARHQIQPHGPLRLHPDLGGGHAFSVEAESPGAAPAVRRKGTGQEHRHRSRQGLRPVPVIPSWQPLDQSQPF